MTGKTETLAEAYPKEQARLRVLLGHYREIGPVGAFGLAVIEATLNEADKAAISGDVLRMIAAYKTMQDCS